MLFHKIQFYSRIYHHHKVRAAECLIKGIFEIIQDNTNFTICGRRMDRAIDFLHVTETDILSLNDKPPELQKYIKRLYNRKLFKRALVISADTVEKPDIHTGYSKLQSLAEDNKSIKSLRQLIVEELDHKYPIYDIWVDLPKTPPTIEGEQTIIQDEGRNTKPRRLSEFFRVGEWLNAYRSVKWQGYVFCPDHPEIRRKVGKKAAKVIEDIYKISFNDNAFEYAKLD